MVSPTRDRVQRLGSTVVGNVLAPRSWGWGCRFKHLGKVYINVVSTKSPDSFAIGHWYFKLWPFMSL